MKQKYRIPLRRKNRIMVTATLSSVLSESPHSISISTSEHSQEEIDFIKDAEEKGLITNVTWINSGPLGFDDTIRYALHCLHSEEARKLGCNILRQYDYAWIKMAIDHGQIPIQFYKLKYMSTPKFYSYIFSLGFTDIAGSKTLNKEIAKARWNTKTSRISFPNSMVNILEIKRRNRIAMKFLELINEI